MFTFNGYKSSGYRWNHSGFGGVGNTVGNSLGVVSDAQQIHAFGCFIADGFALQIHPGVHDRAVVIVKTSAKNPPVSGCRELVVLG